MAEFRKAADFQVQQAIPNARMQALAESIKNFEPEMRAMGRAIDWDKFRNIGPTTTEEDLARAKEAYMALVPDRRPEDSEII
jgi:hypothetical protein